MKKITPIKGIQNSTLRRRYLMSSKSASWQMLPSAGSVLAIQARALLEENAKLRAALEEIRDMLAES